MDLVAYFVSKMVIDDDDDDTHILHPNLYVDQCITVEHEFCLNIGNGKAPSSVFIFFLFP